METITTAVKQSERVEQTHRMMEVLSCHQKFENKSWPVRSNYASKAGHACERYLYYMRHDWDKAQTRYWGGVGILGNMIADWWKMYMVGKGFKLIHDQLPLSDEMAKKYQVGGRIDGRIGWGEIKPVLYEFKTMAPHIYDKINSYEDFANASSEYLRAYPAQIQLYLLSLNEEAGLFVLCNKQNLEWKMIPVYLDYAYCEWLLQRLERVNKANEAGTPPPRIGYGKTCETCEFATTCLPDIRNEGLEMVDNERLQFLLDEREAVKEAHKAYELLDEEAKTMAKAVGKNFMVGADWMVEVKKTLGKRIDTKLIPIEERAKYEKPSETVRVEFVPIGAKNG